jgi:hypothetical protein
VRLVPGSVRPGCGTVVEFVGLSGSGKSTLCFHVGDMLRAEGIGFNAARVEPHDAPRLEVRLRAKKAALAIFDAAAYPGYTYRSAAALAASRHPWRRRYGQCLLSWLYNSSVLRHHVRARGLHLIDDGLFQTLCSIALKAESMNIARFLHSLQRDLPLCRLLIIVHASEEVVLTRLATRKKLRSQLTRFGMPLSEFVPRSADVLAAVRRQLDSVASLSASTTLIEVHNNDPEDLGRAAAIVVGSIRHALWELSG